MSSIWERVYRDIAEARGMTGADADAFVKREMELVDRRRANWPQGLKDAVADPKFPTRTITLDPSEYFDA